MEGGTTYNYTLADDRIDAAVLSDGAADYIHGLGLVSETRSGASKYLHSDALGTTRAWSNGSGAKTDSLDTDAFGMTTASSGTTPKPFGFAGQHGYQSDSTGLMRLGHRYYDASTGRFLSRDPIQDGYNWYAYCNNDPVQKVDPSGLLLSPVLAQIIGGITTIGGAMGLGGLFLGGIVVTGAVGAIISGSIFAIAVGGIVGGAIMLGDGINDVIMGNDGYWEEDQLELTWKRGVEIVKEGDIDNFD